MTDTPTTPGPAPAPRLDFALHLGVAPEHVERVSGILRDNGLTVFVDGDGWNVWGEMPGTDDNDAETLHVIGAFLAADFPRVHALVPRIALEGLLVPMGGHEAQCGIIAALSDFEDFSVLGGREVASWSAAGGDASPPDGPAHDFRELSEELAAWIAPRRMRATSEISYTDTLRRFAEATLTEHRDEYLAEAMSDMDRTIQRCRKDPEMRAWAIKTLEAKRRREPDTLAGQRA